MKKGVISLLSTLTGAAVGAGAIGRIASKKLDKIQGYSDKHLTLYKMMNEWVRVKQEGKNLASYFEKKGYKKIAIYGMSYAGETLLQELKNTKIQVSYGIDRNSNSIYEDVDIYSADDDLPEVDAIVVTAITYFNEIEEMLSEKVDCPVISLEEVLYEV
jgi:hypothetical protein